MLALRSGKRRRLAFVALTLTGLLTGFGRDSQRQLVLFELSPRLVQRRSAPELHAVRDRQGEFLNWQLVLQAVPAGHRCSRTGLAVVHALQRRSLYRRRALRRE